MLKRINPFEKSMAFVWWISGVACWWFTRYRFELIQSSSGLNKSLSFLFERLCIIGRDWIASAFPCTDQLCYRCQVSHFRRIRLPELHGRDSGGNNGLPPPILSSPRFIRLMISSWIFQGFFPIWMFISIWGPSGQQQQQQKCDDLPLNSSL